MIKFKYNKNIDKECWNRIIRAKEMFGHKFPKSFNIKKKDIKKAKEKTKEFQKIWNKNKTGFQKGVKKIYGHSFPRKIVCYVNTSPYSMDNFKKNYISISMYRKDVVSTVIHEASHFMFKKYYTRFCHSIGCNQNDIEEIKEIMTVINNVEFKDVNDYGWRIHQKIREKAKKTWQETHNIRKVIKRIKNNL
ncbi:hypothetical protein KKG24_02750 [Patescibacteria group bacterium]|nr:hypothetical protein [Patescibacteria group bacterium]